MIQKRLLLMRINPQQRTKRKSTQKKYEVGGGTRKSLGGGKSDGEIALEVGTTGCRQ